MDEIQTNENGGVRTNEELRQGIDQGIADVQSARADSWGAALQRQNRERAAQNGMETYGQMREIAGRRELAEIQNGQRAQDAIASALAIAQQNGGKLPGAVTEYLNRQFGFDGKTMGIIDGGIDQKTGEFGFVFGERGNDGKVSYRRQMIPLSAQLGLMEGYPSLFNEEAIGAHRQRMLDSGLSSGEVDAYSKVAKLSRDRLAARIADLTPRDTKLETERLRQEGLNRRADMLDERSNRKLELQQQQLEANIQKQLAAAKSADERNAIIKQAKEAELRLRQQEIEAKYAQMGVQYGAGEMKQTAREKVNAKLKEPPAEISIEGAKPEPASAQQPQEQNDDNAESKEYPGYSNGRARRALSAGWTWNKESGKFVPPKK